MFAAQKGFLISGPPVAEEGGEGAAERYVEFGTTKNFDWFLFLPQAKGASRKVDAKAHLLAAGIFVSPLMIARIQHCQFSWY